ncbi:MAG: ABC transporter permease subunit [Proteobacteria bacterium]|nr:ABC transporter permease subunit [Pseudomonadota bacterium]MBU1390004.1 ABC transporter permease subunit [Pseudomonadota bacterium]MBU1545045.1 ABC transporter permease subunit [Pseudomonadota bacterium]MBU2480351.1 ABC transporter permease subunit [Pseudomonadota bacterium]
MLFRRVYQFLIVYIIGLLSLLGLKMILGLSDYVIPGFFLIIETAHATAQVYFYDVLNTLGVTVLGQCASIIMAFGVGIAGRKSSWAGSFIKVAAYNIQAYPIVALAPIIFILLGDGFLSRLLIASMICYFPLLLSVIGIMASPVTDIEHFYVMTGRMRWQLEVKIRAFENLSKLTTVISGSATLAMAGTIVAEFIAANAGIGYSIRIALYQSDLAKILVALFMIGIIISIYQGMLETLGAKIQSRWSVINKGDAL